MTLQGIPLHLKRLRACLSCSLIKSLEQFENEGCENCDFFLRMKNNMDNVYYCTSANFDGDVYAYSYFLRLIAAMNPEESWVCKWQKIDRLCAGIYAISVSGRLPDEIVSAMERKGLSYTSRDRSRK